MSSTNSAPTVNAGQESHFTAAGRPTLSDVVSAQVGELFDVLTLLKAVGAVNEQIEAAPHVKIDPNGITDPHTRLDTLLRLAEEKVQGALRAFNAVN